MAISKTLYTRLGEKETFDKVHKIFYDKVYAHPWLKQFFTDKPQIFLEEQQTDFMIQIMGGPKRYAGKSPKSAHQHMVITEELFNLRSKMLSESITEAGISNALRDEWLDADAIFRGTLIKNTEAECTKAYDTQPILNFKQ